MIKEAAYNKPSLINFLTNGIFIEHNRAGVLALEHSIIGKEKKHNNYLHISSDHHIISCACDAIASVRTRTRTLHPVPPSACA